jgi:preprotein translocase subunit SecA
VDVSEILSKMLTRAKVRHNVLNAKQHDREAEIVAHAGRKGSVTIATNMAGRGTDIKLDPEVKKNGGLAIIGSERHEARRIDRQLRGRAGRQGDPGSSIFYISLEDKLMRLFAAERIAKLMNTFKMPEGEPITHPMITKTVENAQKKVEENNFSIRKHLLEYDDVMNMQRELIYAKRRSALRGDRLKTDLFDYIYDIASGWYDDYHPDKDLKGLKNQVRSLLLCEINMTEKEFDEAKEADVVNAIVKSAEEFYHRKEEMLGKQYMANLEKFAVLQTIDDKWKEHLRSMDEIKEGINLRAYGQKDPLLEYKGEAVEQFKSLLGEIAVDSVSIAFKYFPQMQPTQVQQRTEETTAPKVRSKSLESRGLKFGRDESATELASRASAPRAQEQEGARGSSVETFKRTEEKVGRNDACPCGSGKKYKNCHGKDISLN